MRIIKPLLAVAAVAALAWLVAIGVGNARASAPLHNDCSRGRVAFTFDDGPGPSPAVVQTLRALNLKATFFVLGNKVDASAASRQVVRDEAAAGFSVQVHTYDHTSLTGASTGSEPLSDAQIADELNRTSAAIVSAGLPRPTLYRPPYGDVSAHDDLLARRLGYRIVMPWGKPTGNIVDAQDWTGISSTAIASNVTHGYTKNGHFYPGIKAGSIVSMHDGEDQASTQNTIRALQPIVDYMNAKHLCSTTHIRRDATGGVVRPPARPEPTKGNLVQNPSLELMRSSGSAPAYFQQAGAKTASSTATWTTTPDAHSGSLAARVDVTNWTSGDRKLVLTQRDSEQSHLARAVPGHSYSMWAWYKGTWPYLGASATKVSFATYYRNAAGTWVYWQSSPLLAPTSGWTLASFTSAALPAGASAISFGLAIHGPGTLTTDDYALALETK